MFIGLSGHAMRRSLVCALLVAAAGTPVVLPRITRAANTDAQNATELTASAVRLGAVEIRPLLTAIDPGVADGADGKQGDGKQGGGDVVVLNIDDVLLAQLETQVRADIDLPVAAGVTLRLEVERFEVLGPEAEIVNMTPDGPRAMARPPVQLWRGRVSGDGASRVFLGLSPLGSSGYVQSGERTFSLSTIAPDAQSVLAGRTVVTDVRELEMAKRDARERRGERYSLLEQAFTCQGAILPDAADPSSIAPATGPVNGARTDRGAGTCRIIRIAIDTDEEFTSLRFSGNATASANYATILMGAVSSVYARDVGASIQVPFLRVWTSTDPYSAANTSAQLPEFQNLWNATPPTAVARDAAHLLSGRQLGGGIAYLSVLCSLGSAYGVSANLGGSFPQPLADNRSGNWDPYVVAHELGHNFSSGHTHEAWAYNPPVDGCGNNFLSPPQAQDCSTAFAGAGTIMSYCHQCSGGVANIDMTFGPRPIARITGYLTGSVPFCGLALSSPIVAQGMTTTGTQCVGATVSLSVSASPGAGETLTYTWYKGAQRLLPNSPSITLANLSSTSNGAYTCEISNGCQTVTRGPVTINVCVADFNCSGGAPSTQDIFDFLTAWFAGNPSADINRFGGIGVQDIFDFLGLWFAGC